MTAKWLEWRELSLRPLQEGVAFYNKLIDSLKAACIEPHITL